MKPKRDQREIYRLYRERKKAQREMMRAFYRWPRPEGIAEHLREMREAGFINPR